jgi:hypothetical protein
VVGHHRSWEQKKESPRDADQETEAVREKELIE